jgi:BatD DUF11 like domain
MKTNFAKIWLAALAFAAVLAMQARAGTVTATLDPAQISLGDSAQLTVTISGSDNQEPIPAVDGLEITNVEHSSFMNIINGAMSSSTSNIYSVTPQREGTFTIPAIHAGSAASQAITLRVGKGSSPAPAPAQVQAAPQPSTGPVVLPQPSAAPAPGAQLDATDKFGSIEIGMPKKEFYEGELVPVEIKLFVPEDVQASVGDLPQFTSDGFTLNSLSQRPEQSEQIVNGRGYNVLEWRSALTAVKTGNYPITLKIPLTVLVMQRVQQPQNADDMFNNFFRNAFNSMGTRKNITLTNKAETLSVLPLPHANRPTNFGGAVGQFEVEASATPTKVNAGDPITLRLKISGTGNFDRVMSDMLPANAQWKTYSTKNHFDAVDSVGYQGAKTFEQPVIPSDSSVTNIPSLSFSFFNPETKQYLTRTTDPIPISVTGGVVNPVASTTVPAGQAPSPKPAAPASDLRPNQIDPGAFVSTLRPIYLNPLFLAGQSLPLLALLSVLFVAQRRRQAAHPGRVQANTTERAIREQIGAMDAAMRDHQAGAFFVHARSALQQRFGQRWNLRPEAITLADVESRLGSANVNVRSIFDMADQASYSDLHFEDSDLQQWRQLVVNELAEKN